MTGPDLTVLSEETETPLLPAELIPGLPLPPEGMPILTEVQAIERLLLAAAQQRLRQNIQQLSRFMWIFGLGLGLSVLLWRLFPSFSWLLLGVTALGGTGVLLLALGRNWIRRDVDALQQFQQVAERDRYLIEALWPFSRAALLHVTASARAADQQVSNRVAFVLGQNRAGGLLGLFLVALGGVTAGKYLEEKKVVVPWIELLITPGVVLAIMLFLFALGATVLLAGHSINALPHFAEFLERVASLKKNLAEDPKETP
jgi:hypothetical protein